MKILMKLILAASVMPVFANVQVNAWHCHNPHHNNCVHHVHNCANHNHNFQTNHCHNHDWASRPSVNFGFSINTPVYKPVYEPAVVVERAYVRPVARPVTKVVTTYTKPVCEVRTYSSPVASYCTTTYTKPASSYTTTYSSYGYPYGVCETVYSSPAVYKTVEVVQPVTATYETIEYRSYQHPVSAALNFVGALVDAFAR